MRLTSLTALAVAAFAASAQVNAEESEPARLRKLQTGPPAGPPVPGNNGNGKGNGYGNIGKADDDEDEDDEETDTDDDDEDVAVAGNEGDSSGAVIAGVLGTGAVLGGLLGGYAYSRNKKKASELPAEVAVKDGAGLRGRGRFPWPFNEPPAASSPVPSAALGNPQAGGPKGAAGAVDWGDVRNL